MNTFITISSEFLKRLFLKKSRVIFFCVTAVAFFLIIFTLVDLFHLKLTVYPARSFGNRIAAFADNYWNGKSEIKEFSLADNRITLEYILKPGAPSPLVFVTINLGSINHPLDLSRFESVSLDIKEATNKQIMIFIKTYVPGISLPETIHADTLRHNQYILPLYPGQHQYTITLTDFITPAWWLEKMNVERTLLPKESYKYVFAFDMQINLQGSDYVLNKLENITIEKISFHRSLSVLHWIGIIIVLCYFGGGGFFLFITLIKRKIRKLPGQKPLDLNSYYKNELHRVSNYIREHYNDPGISTRMIYKALGLSSSRVCKLIRTEYNLTFKQLINKMRIEEAKRLLAKTDLRISEIVFNLGFNNISYFNNLFKLYEGIPPSGYRKKNRMND